MSCRFWGRKFLFLVYSIIIIVIITIIKLRKDVSNGQQFNTQRKNDNAAVL